MAAKFSQTCLMKLIACIREVKVKMFGVIALPSEGKTSLRKRHAVIYCFYCTE